jgi:sporulation protein YlmC with PRC-barrel domain
MKSLQNLTAVAIIALLAGHAAAQSGPASGSPGRPANTPPAPGTRSDSTERSGSGTIPLLPGAVPRATTSATATSQTSLGAQPNANASGMVRWSELVGVSVSGQGATNLGQVRDLMIDPATRQIGFVLLEGNATGRAAGGLTPIPWGLFETQVGAAPGGGVALSLPLTTSRLQSAPSLNAVQLNAGASADWVNNVNTFFQADLAQRGLLAPPGQVRPGQRVDIDPPGFGPEDANTPPFYTEFGTNAQGTQSPTTPPPGTTPSTPGATPGVGTAPGVTNPGQTTPPGTTPAPGTVPATPGTVPPTPGTVPTTPGTVPATPGAAPDRPGAVPATPGTAPRSPSRPTTPGATPRTPTTPGAGGTNPRPATPQPGAPRRGAPRRGAAPNAPGAPAGAAPSGPAAGTPGAAGAGAGGGATPGGTGN